MFESVVWKALETPPYKCLPSRVTSSPVPVSKHAKLGNEYKSLLPSLQGSDCTVDLHPQPEIYSLSGSHQ